MKSVCLTLRQHWRSSFFGFTVALLLLGLGSHALLHCFDLQFRPWVYSAGLLYFGCAGLIEIFGVLSWLYQKACASAEKRAKRLWTAGTILSALLSLAFLVYAGPLGFLILCFSVREETVTEHNGQMTVRVEEGFLDIVYRYYPYHGPIIMGDTQIDYDYEG